MNINKRNFMLGAAGLGVVSVIPEKLFAQEGEGGATLENKSLTQKEIDQDILLNMATKIQEDWDKQVESEKWGKQSDASEPMSQGDIFNATRLLGQAVANFLKNPSYTADDVPFGFDTFFAEFTALVEKIEKEKLAQEDIYPLVDEAAENIMKYLRPPNELWEMRERYVRGFLCGLDERLCPPTN